MGLMAVVGHGSLQRDNPHHESNSILLGPHVPRSHQDIESSEGVPFEVGEGVETRREDSLIRDIYKPRTSEDRLIQIAEYPNSSQRSPFAPFLHERQPKSISVRFIFWFACLVIAFLALASIHTCRLRLELLMSFTDHTITILPILYKARQISSTFPSPSSILFLIVRFYILSKYSCTSKHSTKDLENYLPVQISTRRSEERFNIEC